jgi:hypothetical protein
MTEENVLDLLPPGFPPDAAPSLPPPVEDGDDELLGIENDETIDTTMVVEVQDFVNRVEDIMTSETDTCTVMGPQLLKELGRLPTTKDVTSKGQTLSRILKVPIFIIIYLYVGSS